MENFQYSVHLSEQEWAEFSATAAECDLLQASLASGDDTDPGDSSGSSPPGPLSHPKGQSAPAGRRGQAGFEEEDKAVTRQLVSRSWHESGPALGASQQTPGTSTGSEVWPSLDSGQSSSFPRPPGVEMQRLLQGPAPRDPVPSAAEEASQSLEAPARNAAPIVAPSSPGATTRSPSRKKRRSAGAKAGGRSGTLGPTPVQGADAGPGGPGPQGEKPLAVAATRTPGTRQEDSRGSEQAALDPPASASASPTKQGQDLLTMTSVAEPCTGSLLGQGGCPDSLGNKSDRPLSTPASKIQPDTPLSAPVSKPQPGSPLSTPASKPQPDSPLSAPAPKPQSDSPLSTSTSKIQSNTPLSTLASKPQPNSPLSTPASKPPSDSPLCTPASKPQSNSPLSTPASKPQPDSPLSAPAPKPQSDSPLPTSTSKVRPNTPLSTPASKPHPDFLLPHPDFLLSAPASKPPSDSPLCTPASKPQSNSPLSTPASKIQPDTPLSMPASKPQSNSPLSMPAIKPQSNMPLSTRASASQSDTLLSIPASKPQPSNPPSTPTSKIQAEVPLWTPVSKPQPDTPLSTPTPKPRLDPDLCSLSPAGQPELGSAPVETAQSSESLPPPGPTAPSGQAALGPGPVPTQEPGPSPVVAPGWSREEPTGGQSAGSPGHPPVGTSAGSAQVSKRKKVRFSMPTPCPEEPGSAGGPAAPSPASVWPSAPRTAVGAGPGAWDAVAVGSRPPQPRILKHLPPPAPFATASYGSRSSFVVTLPEAYEFFFCDTIEEEDEEAEEAAEAPTEVQWPDVCEFFFRDSRAQRPGHRAGVQGSGPEKQQEPITIPEAYEHFLGDGQTSVLEPAVLQLQARVQEPPPQVLAQEAGLNAPRDQLQLALRQAGEPWSPLTPFTVSQKDMCLVFVAFASWAVRTSDLHTPDAWKTVLLANLGTISAIRYFRRQVSRGRRSPPGSRSPSPSS
ncbi:PGC-1 and ERR-induced regulator in muscle protein 1 [Suncus etruscus]|uniref:PGC-1 and ERR-induced regulator in muscle protein 1 n=1 Tax=Suncus etruscus TaxID=109475 RepID=UPI00210F480B|nr:PGC-1 and ERR-induced regulator in muscle protein 1 [Suncus etruscus]